MKPSAPSSESPPTLAGKPRDTTENGSLKSKIKSDRTAPSAKPGTGNNIILFLIQLPEAFSSIVLNTTAEVFPGAQILRVRSVKEARTYEIAGQRQLLVLTDQDETEVALAAQTTDAKGMPRWAVVILGNKPSELAESVPMEECTAKVLGRVFRTTLQQHELVRENLQLRGDLKTLSHRLRHDFTGSLHCIQLNCELITELLSDNASLAKSQISSIRKSLFEMDQLMERVDDMLKASSEPYFATRVSMFDVIQNVLSQLEEEIHLHGAAVLHPANWPEVDGVGKWLEVIWRNLILNAIKHGARAEQIKLDWGVKDATLRFWVVNRGPAVPAGLEANLFTPFELLHTQRGSGLGLCLVQRLVGVHGGKCGYERQGDGHSLFYFTLAETPSSLVSH
ncbi:MAG TPA: HAMP domain-containing sensor histidine kinase [Opitutales bacterium]|nr:HAMP domain-containing sensor histidine kinase [Opitutales bacterium]